MLAVDISDIQDKYELVTTIETLSQRVSRINAYIETAHDGDGFIYMDDVEKKFEQNVTFSMLSNKLIVRRPELETANLWVFQLTEKGHEKAKSNRDGTAFPTPETTSH